VLLRPRALKLLLSNSRKESQPFFSISFKYASVA
jgi:hypothetical protein